MKPFHRYVCMYSARFTAKFRWFRVKYLTLTKSIHKKSKKENTCSKLYWYFQGIF